jgi:DNA polymerase-1
MSKLIALDTETESLTDKTLVAFSVYDGKIKEVIPVKMNTTKNTCKTNVLAILKGLLKEYKIIFHNASFDIPVLLQFGVSKECFRDIEDTLIMANLVDENMQHGLKKLVKKFFKYEMTEYKELCGTGKKRVAFKDIPWDEAKKYAGEDAYYTYRLYTEIMLPRLEQDPEVYELYQKVERPLVKIVAMMHHNGITIDKARVDEIAKKCAAKIELNLSKLRLLMGPCFEDMNLNSSKQLKEYFINKLNMPIIKTSSKTNEPSVDKEVLKIYAETNAEAKALLEYRKYSKILGTFIPALTPIEGEKIYASFNQAGTVSGRFSSSRPNMQNIPRENKYLENKELNPDYLGIREAFVPENGNIFVGADYSQIELRVLAHFSKDDNLMVAYRNKEDIHQKTADACGTTRQKAKTVNFGIVYGMGAKKLAKEIKVSVPEAEHYIKKYGDTYPGVRDFWNDTEKSIRSTGYVKTLMGRKRRRSNFFFQKDDYDQGAEIRSMTNAIIQGSAADLIKLAMVNMAPQLEKHGAKLILTVHDEVLVSCPPKAARQVFAIVHRSMTEAAIGLDVPVEVDVKFGRTWQEAHGDGAELEELEDDIEE